METQIRNLGGEYACFGLLYWNIGKDVDEYGGDYDSYSILNSGLGGRGDWSDNDCVNDGYFAKGSYRPYWCPASWASEDGQCCLKRDTWANSKFTSLFTSVDSESVIVGSEAYDRTRSGIEDGPHDKARM